MNGRYFDISQNSRFFLLSSLLETIKFHQVTNVEHFGKMAFQGTKAWLQIRFAIEELFSTASLDVVALSPNAPNLTLNEV